MPPAPPDDDDDGKPRELPPEIQAQIDAIIAGDDDNEICRELDRDRARELARPERSASTPLEPTLDMLVKEIRVVEENYESPAFRAIREFLDEPAPEGPTFYQFGRFEVHGVETGGMGLVLEARDPLLDRKVAIKLWKRKGAGAREALFAEAKTLARFSHPNVVTIYEPGIWKERVFFVMEWIEGVDGYMWLVVRKPSWQNVRDVFVAAGRGLAAAHEVGIQHRDFKPSNILIGYNGRTVIADFGVAESAHTIAAYREPGKILGTPVYMAPERLRGELGDARSDQFSFCASLWRALHGVRPFAGETIDELLAAIEAGEIQTGEWTEDAPPWMSRIARRGLAEDPGLRFADMHELIDALLAGPPPDEAQAEEAPDDGAAEAEDRGLLNTPEVERPDVPEPVEAVVEDPAPGERAPVRMPPTPETKARNPWMLMSFGLMVVVVGFLVLAIVREISLASGPGQEPVDDLLARTTRARMTEPAPGCALPETADPQAEVDPVLREVCRLIQTRDDQGNYLFAAAEMLWIREWTARKDRHDTTVGDDTLTIARTYVVLAEALEHEDPSTAKAAAEYAFRWADRATFDLGRNHESNQIKSLANQIATTPP